MVRQLLKKEWVEIIHPPEISVPSRAGPFSITHSLAFHLSREYMEVLNSRCIVTQMGGVPIPSPQ